jgi:hypothetical protein
VAPSSITRGIRPARLAATCAARVGLIEPLALAEGAASGRPHAASKACIARCAGTRIAIVGSPAVTSEAIPASARNGSTKVSGPGQNRSARSRATASNTAIRSAAARSGTCTISGLKLGRPFAA